jgi:2-phosphoglycerate kinase
VNTLYILGGPPRAAKTTIMSGLAKELGIAFIAADAIEHGVRNVLTSEPHQMLRDIEFAGSAEWKTSITEGGERRQFSNKATESELTLQAIIGMLDYYRRNNESVAFEGAAFTPQIVKSLKVPGFTIKAVFVGFTNPAHAYQVIEYARSNPHDWINSWLKSDSEEKIRDWITKQAEKCVELKIEAKELEYPFFDISTMPFEQYIASAQKCFLEV